MSIPGAFRPLGRDENIINSKSYVQDGLILHLDGIDNAGFGNHVSSLSQWVDLSGNGNHAGTNSGLATFNSDSWQGNGSTYFNLPGTFFNTQNQSQKWTVECVFIRGSGVDDPALLSFGGPYNGTPQVKENIIILSRSKYNSQASYGQLFIRVGENYVAENINLQNEIRSICINRNTGTFKIFDNGNYYTSIQNGSTPVTVNQYKYIGVSTAIPPRYNTIPIQCVRVYDRPLTESEISKNYEIDQIRFKLN